MHAVQCLTRNLTKTSRPLQKWLYSSPASNIVHTKHQSVLVWVDAEFTGLQSDSKLCEIAILITDDELNIIDEGIEMIVNLEQKDLEKMDPWCVETFTKSGLLEKIKNSKISLPLANENILQWWKNMENQFYILCEPNNNNFKAPLCGNSVHMDRAILQRECPEFEKKLHYRNVDVSTIKELAQRWYPEIWKCAPLKKKTHRAKDDILESIEELKYYQKYIFK